MSRLSIHASVLVVLLAVWAAPAPAHGQSAQPIPLEPGRRLQGFSVVLVEGDLGAATAQPTVTGAANKALADMKDFLPYKSYRLLDSQWILGTGGMSLRLRGPSDETYDLELRASYPHYAVQAPERPGPVVFKPAARVSIVRFRLSDARGPASSGQRGAADPHVAAQQFHAGLIGRQQLEYAERAASAATAAPSSAAGSPLIDTSFTMDIGETVVVGTSRLQGNKALIVLLTAVPK